MNYVSKSIFNFKGFGVKRVLRSDKSISVYLFSRRKTAQCPKCKKRSKNVYEIGKLRKVKHSIFEGKQVVLFVPKRRYTCNVCRLPFNEQIDWIAFRARSTANFSKETMSGLRNSSFTVIQEMYDTSYQFLSKNLKKLDLSVKWPKGRLKLGFDEHLYAKRHMVVTVTELSSNTLLAILPHYDKKSVEEYLKKRTDDELNRVDELCFDMKFKQRKIVGSFFPNATTVVDKFHVLSYLARLIDSDRRLDAPRVKNLKSIRQIMRKPKRCLTIKEYTTINSLFKQYPKLKERWDIYQKLSSFYRLEKKDHATRQLLGIKADLLKLEYSNTKDFLGTIDRFQVEILNYFNSRTTNAFTEGVHTKIKMIKRTSFGFRNIEVYIKKVMLAFIPMLVALDQLLPH